MANNNGGNFEKQLFKAADKLRKNIDAADYKHVVLGLIFLKYISDSFEELYKKLEAGKGDYEGADPEDKDEYKGENVFWVPPTARWSYLHSRAKLPTIGSDIDDAMEAIEKENPTMKGILAKVYARPNLDKTVLGSLIDLIGNAPVKSCLSMLRNSVSWKTAPTAFLRKKTSGKWQIPTTSGGSQTENTKMRKGFVNRQRLMRYKSTTLS